MAGLNESPCGLGELITAYLDGELLAGELDRVVRHLSDCRDCIAEFRRCQEMRTALRTLPRLEIPESLLPSLHYGPELSAYLDGELATVELKAISSHLEACRECRSELHELDSARTAIRSLPRIEPPAFLDARRRPDDLKPNRGVRRYAGLTAGIAAAAVIALGVISTGPAPRQVDVANFADRHLARASVEAGFTVIPAVSTGNTP